MQNIKPGHLISYMFSHRFADNEIDKESFYLLDDETLKEIMPVVGPRLKFKKELKLLKVKQNPEIHRLIKPDIPVALDIIPVIFIQTTCNEW